MRDAGLDISSQQPSPITEVAWGDFDTVITLCAEEVCAVPPRGMETHHWPLPDPAAATGADDEMQGAFRRTRDEIERRLQALKEGCQSP
jgi:arsenate reductase